MSGALNTGRKQDIRTMRTSSTRKARNNKVYTAKGPRDRRIRLSAEIAIQFYDVQDRLGYERASEALDWLISKAKGSIDKLFDSSFEQKFEHIASFGDQHNLHLGDYLAEHDISGVSRSEHGISFHQGDCLPESMSSREDYSVADFDNNCSVECSNYLACTQIDNSLKDHQCLEHNSVALFQQIDEKVQFPRMFMCNSKPNTRNEEHTLVPDYVPFMTSSVHSPTSDPTLNLCLPGYSTSTLSDTEHWTIF